MSPKIKDQPNQCFTSSLMRTTAISSCREFLFCYVVMAEIAIHTVLFCTG